MSLYSFGALSILSNSIKHTKKGFIDVEIDTIARYDVCRMVFTIKDSGSGMSISQINEVLSSSDSIDISDFEEIDSLELELPVVIKILKTSCQRMRKKPEMSLL